MTGSGDYYEVLGVPRDADTKTIKNAFRQLARRYHPDTSTEPDAEQRFKEIAEAYGVLSDPAKRASYDAQGSVGLAGATAEDLWGGIDFADIFGSAAEAFGSLFERLPGGGADRRDTRSHDPPPRPMPAVRGQRIPARHCPASLPGLRRDRTAGGGPPPPPPRRWRPRRRTTSRRWSIAW